MYNLLIADDEDNIRNGLKLIIDWKALGFAIAGDAANGEEALEKIARLEPDLVLMDLHMPGIHGLDVIRLSRERGYRGRFIVISGYSEFAYAQSAIRYGVTDYLTKPVDEELLERQVRAVAAEISREREDSGRIGRIYRKAGAAYFRELVEKEEGTVMEPSEEELRSMNLYCDLYQPVLFESYHTDRARKVTFHAEDLLDNFMKRDAYECITENGREAVLLKGKAAGHLFRRLKDRLAETIMQSDSPLDSVFLTYGPAVTTIGEIHASYEIAATLLGKRFYCEKGQHVLGFDDREAETVSHGELDPSRKEVWKRGFLDAVLQGSRRKAEDLLSEMEEYFQALQAEEHAVRLFLSDLYLEIRESVVHLWPDRKSLFESNTDILRTIGSRTFLYEILDYFDRNIGSLIDETGTRTGTGDAMRDVLDYIDRNFAENLKLETLAPMFGYNSAYFGKIFTRETGMNFNNYLNARRIDESRRLLRENRFRIYEIAERCGFNNVDYFSKKFHHYMGMSPAEYRRSPEAD